MKKICWIDLEMTGLDVNKEVIIEAAVIITDINFEKIIDYHAVVKQDQRYIDAMDDWNTKHHKESGLVDLIPSGKHPDKVELELLELVDEQFGGDKVVIAGNSIAQDRLFLDKYFPKFSEKLHYRMLDVTSWKLLLKNKFGVDYQKKNAHRAIDDIQESIEEMKHYLSFVKV